MENRHEMVVNAIYRPKQGFEDKVIALINNKVVPLAASHGVENVEVFRNTETGEIIATGRYRTKVEAESFMINPELREITREINNLCDFATRREALSVLKEAA